MVIFRLGLWLGLWGEGCEVVLAEAQGLSFVGSTGGEDSNPRLWNLQNLGLAQAPPQAAAVNMVYL